MSHYAVAVFSDDGDFDRLLEPYDENNKKYFEFVPKAFEVIEADFNNFKKQNKGWTLQMYIENFGYIEEDGAWGYRHNPNGYWDWYTLDGKDYMFPLKDEYDCDGPLRKNDYDWYPINPDEKEDAEDFWDDFIEDGAIASPPGIWNRKYFLERYKTKEQYVKEMCRTVPYAFITPDGVWHAPGRVGWFASSDETAEDWNAFVKEWDRFIRSDSNPYVSLVDCHI